MINETDKKLHSQYIGEWNAYQQWLNANGFPESIKEAIDFYEGKQWPQITKDTADLPRPVYNITSLIVNSQISNILGRPVKLNFIASGDKVMTDVITQFTDYAMKKAQFEKYLEEYVKDAEVKCSGFAYVYWDEFSKSADGKYKGAVKLERIDPLDIAFSHPNNANIQQQEWIIVRKPESIKNVKKIAKRLSAEEIRRFIVPSTKQNQYSTTLSDEELNKDVIVYTKFFRRNGEVYFVKFTDNVILHDPKPCNPKETIKIKKEEELKELENYNALNATDILNTSDGANTPTNDSSLEPNRTDRSSVFGNYPFAMLNTVEKEQSILGLGTAHNVIPNNKLINLTMAYNLLNTQNVAWGKYIVKKGALGNNQKINNKPGQVLVDYSKDGWGISTMPGQQTLSNGAVEQAQISIDLTRSMFNSDEIMTGDMLSKNLSGTAIAQIEAMRTKNVDRKQKRVWRFCEDIGKILLQYYVCYYKSEVFPYEMNDKLYQEVKRLDSNAEKFQNVEFTGDDIRGINFDIVCEAGAGSQFSEIMQMQMLDNLLAAERISFETYVELYPSNQMPFKGRLLQKIEAQNQSELEQWKQAYNDLLAQAQGLEQQVGVANSKANQMQSYANSLKKTFKEALDNKNTSIKQMQDYMASIKGTPLTEEDNVSNEGNVN